jgi:hypothetical protein
LEARTVLPQTSSEAILKPQTAGQILVAAKGLHWSFDQKFLCKLPAAGIGALVSLSRNHFFTVTKRRRKVSGLR